MRCAEPRAKDAPQLIEFAAREAREGDVVVTMGAGDIDEVARGLADRLR